MGQEKYSDNIRTAVSLIYLLVIYSIHRVSSTYILWLLPCFTGIEEGKEWKNQKVADKGLWVPID